MPEIRPTPNGAFARLLPPASGRTPARALIADERRNVAIAAVMARRRRAADLAAHLSARYDLSLPEGPYCQTNSRITFIGMGPNVWLAMKADADFSWTSALAEDLAAYAAVSDQSSAYATLRLRGAHTRDLLQRGVSIDLHPTTFPIGSAAVTDIAHIGAILTANRDDSFDVAVFRSYAASFWRWLSVSADACGLSLISLGLDS